MFAVIVVSSLFALVSSYHNGPPEGACQSMTPNHNVTPQTVTAPYTITMNTTSYSANGVIEVTVQGTANETFKGVFVQARKKCGDAIVGTFSLEQGETELKLLKCSKSSSSAVGHNSRVIKTIKTFYWTAPAQTQGHLYFRGTVVQSKPVFWVGIASSLLKDSTDLDATCGCSGTRALQWIVLFSVVFVFLLSMKY